MRLIRWSAARSPRRWDDFELQYRSEDHRMHIASIGIDLGKTTYHLLALGENG